jgi:microcystin-dependent protein
MNPGTVSVTGSSQPHENMPPYLVVNFVIALQGIFPSQS